MKSMLALLLNLIFFVVIGWGYNCPIFGIGQYGETYDGWTQMSIDDLNSFNLQLGNYFENQNRTLMAIANVSVDSCSIGGSPGNQETFASCDPITLVCECSLFVDLVQCQFSQGDLLTLSQDLYNTSIYEGFSNMEETTIAIFIGEGCPIPQCPLFGIGKYNSTYEGWNQLDVNSLNKYKIQLGNYYQEQGQTLKIIANISIDDSAITVSPNDAFVYASCLPDSPLCECSLFVDSFESDFFEGEVVSLSQALFNNTDYEGQDQFDPSISTFAIFIFPRACDVINITSTQNQPDIITILTSNLNPTSTKSITTTRSPRTRKFRTTRPTRTTTRKVKTTLPPTTTTTTTTTSTTTSKKKH